MARRSHLLIILAAVSLLLTACRERGKTPDDLPTRIPSFEAVATSTFMTQNAPPPGFRETLAFARIDDNLPTLPNWRYEVLLQFDGVFSRTPRQVSASSKATVWYNQLGQQRRVVLEGAGELFGLASDTLLEGVRLGGDTFLVRDHVCAGQGGEQTAVLADLSAGDLIGGVQNATPDGHRAVINGQDVWRYTFTLDDLTLPQIQTGADSLIVMTGGEMWVAPEHHAVIRFYVNLDVQNILLRLVDSSLPLTGTLILRYDLYDIGIDPNITLPYGC